MIITEQDLVKIRNRDPEIFECIFTEYRKKVYTFLIIKTSGNHQVAEELCSETFLSALKSAPKLKQVSNIQSWLIKIAHRRLFDYQRSLYREKKYSEMIRNEPVMQEDFIEKLHEKEKRLLLSLALENIKPKFKIVLKMKYNDNKRVKEIAVLLKQKEKDIENLLFRAKKVLKREMQGISKSFF